MFDRGMSLQAAALLAISTKDGQIQIQRMAQQNRPHRPQRHSQQGLGHLDGVPIAETVQEASERIRGWKSAKFQQARKQRIPPIPGEMLKPCSHKQRAHG